ncbi:O-methyltransferase ZRP4 [Citrus sinensis]|uniref:O-methyltransferase ZRP4 n=1 Tax=Citrus sinensis TaxID=2711 RepID=A0ACB8I0M6_CITSI|nr:O-methyltransferase ZRP4 [Citrus sinensis]
MDANQDQGAKELLQGQAQLYKLMFSHLSSMSLKCAIELGIADIIHSHGRAITLSELVSALDIQPTKTTGLFRLMRLLVHSSCFNKTKVNGQEEAYGLTAASTLLIKDKPYCMSPTVSAFVDPLFVAPFQSLSIWFKGTELTLWETVHGITFWEFMNQNPAINQRFNEAMASDSEIMTSFVVKSECKQIFEGLGLLVDVGGGDGSFSRIICEAFPGIKCTVLDLPHVVANLPEADNLKYIAGDMFQFIPPADAFLFKCGCPHFFKCRFEVYHIGKGNQQSVGSTGNGVPLSGLTGFAPQFELQGSRLYWENLCLSVRAGTSSLGCGDEDGLKILKKRREAIASNGERGKVIIIDIVINAEEEGHELTETKFLFDIVMSVNATGKERTENEWAKLFFDAGFSHYKITPIFGMRSLIEVYP